MNVVPVFLAIVGVFFIAGMAAYIVEKIGTHGPDMAKILTIVITVAGLGIAVGILTQIVSNVETVFNLH